MNKSSTIYSNVINNGNGNSGCNRGVAEVERNAKHRDGADNEERRKGHKGPRFYHKKTKRPSVFLRIDKITFMFYSF